MSGRRSKVIGKSKFSSLEDFLITCYIVKVSSSLLDYSSTTGESPSIYTKIDSTFLPQGIMHLAIL